MYVAKFSRAGVRWDVRVFDKSWSQEMLSNEIKEISSKRFFLHSSAYRWINKEIAKNLFLQHKLEIIDG